METVCAVGRHTSTTPELWSPLEARDSMASATRPRATPPGPAPSAPETAPELRTAGRRCRRSPGNRQPPRRPRCSRRSSRTFRKESFLARPRDRDRPGAGPAGGWNPVSKYCKKTPRSPEPLRSLPTPQRSRSPEPLRPFRRQKNVSESTPRSYCRPVLFFQSSNGHNGNFFFTNLPMSTPSTPNRELSYSCPMIYSPGPQRRRPPTPARHRWTPVCGWSTTQIQTTSP